MEIRRSYERLISTIGFPILVRWHLYIESGPRRVNLPSVGSVHMQAQNLVIAVAAVILAGILTAPRHQLAQETEIPSDVSPRAWATLSQHWFAWYGTGYITSNFMKHFRGLSTCMYTGVRAHWMSKTYTCIDTEYLGRNTSIPLLVMFRLLVSPGHQLQCYQPPLCRINVLMSSMGMASATCVISVLRNYRKCVLIFTKMK